jgi:nicotinamidase-related amidase
MSDPLIIVDVINEFTHHIPQRIARLIQQGEYAPLLFTRFINAPDGPYQRLLNWCSCESEPEINIAPELEPWVKPERVFSKRGLCGMPDNLASYLREQRIERVFLVGIDTDMCVLKLAMDFFDMGIEPIVLTDCCASTAGLQAHLAGLAVLSRNIGANRLRDAGLSGGSLAAPVEQDEA